MKTIMERLAGGEVLVADGAMGTLLMRKGLKQGECPELFNYKHPEVIEEIAALYFNAGADIVHTNTFGGSALKLSSYGLDDKTEEINAAAVRAARKAVGEAGYISVSCGPSGKLLKPFGDTEQEDLYDSFERQLKGAIGEGVDMVTVETMTDIIEATLAITAAKSISPAIPVMATMTFDYTPKGAYTIMGVNVEKAAEELRKAGADIVGSNCGNGIELLVEIAREFKNNTDLPLAIQANAGLPELRDGEIVYLESPEFMADKSRQLMDLGVSIIGGCCGTSPEHIKALRTLVDST